MNSVASSRKIAFVTDERLSHARKTEFHQFISRLKIHFSIEVFSAQMGEKDFLDRIKGDSFSLVLLPWYHYLKWKHVEQHFGSLRMDGPNVAGYFADAVLPFELSEIPHYHRMILLDFYRMDTFEVEALLGNLIFHEQRSGFKGLIPKSSTIFYQNWFEHDRSSTRCIDAIVNSTLIKSSRWAPRIDQIRFYLTALWSLCFQDQHQSPSLEPCGEVELAEFSKRLAIKFVFQDRDLTLKHMMQWTWPPEHQGNPMIEMLVKNADFVRIHHFPETQKLEVTALFTPTAPVLSHPGEVRGLWIEPQKLKYLKNSEEEGFSKRVPIHSAKDQMISDQFLEILEQLKAVHMQLGSVSHEERFILEHQISNLRFLINSIEKKVAEKKKVA